MNQPDPILAHAICNCADARQKPIRRGVIVTPVRDNWDCTLGAKATAPAHYLWSYEHACGGDDCAYACGAAGIPTECGQCGEALADEDYLITAISAESAHPGEACPVLAVAS